MERFKIADTLTGTQKYFTHPFENLPHDTPSPKWGMSLLAAGSMRFRWNEVNQNRDDFFKTLSATVQIGNTTYRGDENRSTTQSAAQVGKATSKGEESQRSDAPILTPVPVQLDHTKIVYDVKSASDTFEKIGDGIITKNKSLIPTVTTADCMPIFLFDPMTEVFGIVHSGWKGTGIIGEAVKLAEKNYGAKPGDFRVAIGPHIRDCCYIVDESRAKYFMENFCDDCVKKIEKGEPLPKFAWNNGNGSLYRLSLEKANLSVLEKIGVREENISVCEDCTACNTIYGSNRRETASLPKVELQSSSQNSANGKTKSHFQDSVNNDTTRHFTPMASFVMW